MRNYFHKRLNYLTQYLLAFTAIISVLQLWPFDFSLNGVRWNQALKCIEFQQKGQIISRSSANNLYTNIIRGTGISLEVLFKTQNTVMTGPARIVSYSSNTGRRNFTLGQSGKKLDIRIRTTETDLNGMNPHLVLDHVFDYLKLQHITVTYDLSEQCVYVDGKKRICEELPGGNFDTWDPSYFLYLGNEATGDRPWLGKLYLVSIYNRALNEKEIQENYHARLSSRSQADTTNIAVSRGLVSYYSFDENAGREIHDKSITGVPLNLYIPEMIRNFDKSYFAFPDISLSNISAQLLEAMLHVLVFILLGFLFHAVMRNRFGTSLKIATIVFITVAFFGFVLESLQHLSLSRHSSSLDFICHLVGTFLGIYIDKSHPNWDKAALAS